MPGLTFTKEDNGKTFETKAGEIITVRLSENPTTGYTWAIDRPDDQLLGLQSSDYISAPGNLAGRGGERVFTFKTGKAGQAVLQLKLWREWQGDKSVVERYNIILHFIN